MQMLKTKKTKGVSLVELILSIAVLSILCVYVVQMFLTSQKLNREAEILDRSVIVSESIFELIEKDSTLSVLFNSTLFKFATKKENQGDFESIIYLDEEWRPVGEIAESSFVLSLAADEIPALEYTKKEYTIKIEQFTGSNLVHDLEKIYEIQMYEYY